MSVRLLTTRLAKHGRHFLQSYWKRDIHANILEHNQNRARIRYPTLTATELRSTGGAVARNVLNATARTGGGQTTNVASSIPRNGIFRFGQHARKLFIDNILNRVTASYSKELRSQATKKLFYGDSAPFFALVGVSLASGAGMLTKEDELEGVCWEIREAAGRLQSTWNKDEISDHLGHNFNLDSLNIGPPIAKGCAAVVYAASFKTDGDNSKTETVFDDVASDAVSRAARSSLQQQRTEMMSPMQNMSRFVHNFGGSVDNLLVYSQSAAAVAFVDAKCENTTQDATNHQDIRRSDAGFVDVSNGAHNPQSLRTSHTEISRYPLALKMMFNYDIQSNALSILRAMYKETVPARQRRINESAELWERHVQDQTLTLPAHPNIVCMFGFFCDEVRSLPYGNSLYPMAQPQRINPLGYGRNMSLYLLMKRYDFSLRGFLDSHALSTRAKLLLLAQLLEAVAHINSHGIAHRDLKSDNILIETNDDDSSPVLVLSDFGCCLADKVHGLQVPYNSFDIDKGGNAALMAPEIINKQPGPFAVLNYARADLWACGAIAYEIFGLPNPFYSASGGRAQANGQQTFSLRNSDYKTDELPEIGDECPALVQQLVHNILNPSPSKRVTPDVAANVMQLYLWAPSNWMKTGGMPSSPEILQWLLSLTTKIMYDGRLQPYSINNSFSFNQTGRRTYVEYLLICSFLSRARLRCIRRALNWIQNVV